MLVSVLLCHGGGKDDVQQRYSPVLLNHTIACADETSAFQCFWPPSMVWPGDYHTRLTRNTSPVPSPPLPPMPIQLQEHAARTLCTLLSANKKIRRKALHDGFLDKLQVVIYPETCANTSAAAVNRTGLRFGVPRRGKRKRWKLFFGSVAANFEGTFYKDHATTGV